MKILVCGAGDVGWHAVERLLRLGEHELAVLDTNRSRLENLANQFDVSYFVGSCTLPSSYEELRIKDFDLLVAATARDEANLIASDLASTMHRKQGGPNRPALRTIVRIHDERFMREASNIRSIFQATHLLCPEEVTVRSIVGQLRNPGAVRLEQGTGGVVSVQSIELSNTATVGHKLRDLELPGGARVVALRRDGESIFPGPGTEFKPGDKILLAGPTDTFESARRAIEGERARAKRLVIGGSSQMARRLCEALAGTPWHITVFDPDPKAAHAMADAFDHIDVEQADPTDRAVFDEAEIDKADAFVSLTESDEHNLLASSTAHSRGVPNTVAVVKSANFEHLGKALGITKVLVPRTVAAREIQELLNEENVSRIPGKFMEGISGWRIRLPESSPLAGVELTSAGLSGRFIVLARCRDNVWDFARSNERLGAGDQLLVVGRSELEDEIPSTFLESGSPA